MEKETINKELETALLQWAKSNETVPEDYFAKAPQNVLQAIKAKKKKSTLIFTLSKLAVAAVLIALIANFYFTNNQVTLDKVNTIALKDLSTEEIETYLVKNDLDLTAMDDKSLNNEMEDILIQSQDSSIN
jgi:phage FluMu gp28-like protein